MGDQAVVPQQQRVACLLDEVIPFVRQIEAIFAHIGSSYTIEFPQIVAVGSQGSGKSSVLEAILGREFLPKGSDICTRRPLLIQLVRSKDEQEYGEFLHIPGRKFYDFNEIRTQIQAETDREAGGNKGISDKEIRLKIFSPNFLDITLVDLPGITKVPVGDQPSDIEARIRTMIMSYIENPNCLILAVAAGDADFTKSDAVQIAGNADPDRNRTIGVITKVDILYRKAATGTFKVGKLIPLRDGYVGVVNRSQEDIMLNRTIKDALVAEEKFFRGLRAYNKIACRSGVPRLVKVLNQILGRHLHNTVLPVLKSHVRAMSGSSAKKLAAYRKIAH